jgi:hypothetical protein
MPVGSDRRSYERGGPTGEPVFAKSRERDRTRWRCGIEEQLGERARYAGRAAVALA